MFTNIHERNRNVKRNFEYFSAIFSFTSRSRVFICWICLHSRRWKHLIEKKVDESSTTTSKSKLVFGLLNVPWIQRATYFANNSVFNSKKTSTRSSSTLKIQQHFSRLKYWRWMKKLSSLFSSSSSSQAQSEEKSIENFSPKHFFPSPFSIWSQITWKIYWIDSFSFFSHISPQQDETSNHTISIFCRSESDWRRNGKFLPIVVHKMCQLRIFRIFFFVFPSSHSQT